ncbi:SAM-dependent methyltransferase [Methanolinea mesophila]|uniref:class I SAM-dependent methyltransferase n=1 Tax=Methanolinea mesophila TaxID=547055 RepID=UPI001AEA5F0A|nr:class I SAM-dependent methyltransferase [Methanolinea mesophila]MBP1927784.1 SAM-dependent methyltransferase [Methanolinea mesophila]
MTSEDCFHQVFGQMPRQGPGYPEATRKAWSLIPSVPPRPVIVDIGCGTGTQTRDLAGLTDGSITAVDVYEPFLEKIAEWAQREGLSKRVRTVKASMDDLPFDRDQFDIIWSEGAIDIMGFEKGLSLWKQYCKKGGHIVVSDLTLFAASAPEELIEFWKPYGVTISTEEEKARQISAAGLQLLHTFRLEKKGWTEYFYEPMGKVIEALRKEKGDIPECAAVLDALEQEGVMYRKYGNSYGYSFFVMRNP